MPKNIEKMPETLAASCATLSAWKKRGIIAGIKTTALLPERGKIAWMHQPSKMGGWTI
jgi:hypothetical protein